MIRLRYPYLFIFCLILWSCQQKKSNSALPDHPAFKDSTVRSISEKIAEAPGNAALYYQRGLVLNRLEYDTLAIKDFRKAATLDSSRAEYFSAVGDLMFEHKDVSGSVPWIEKAVSLNPNDPQARLKIAKLFVFIKEYPKAFNEINTVLRQNAMNPEGYFLKGLIYKDIKDTAKAISSFQTALQVDPSYAEAMIQLGAIYTALKDPVGLKYYENAFRANPSDVYPLYAKGMYLQEQGQLEPAKQEYRSAILHNKDYERAYFSMGYILMQQDSLEKAWRQFDLVTRLDPVNAKAYYNRGLCSELMGRKEDAVQDYKQALTFEAGYKEAQDGVKRLSR